MWQGPRVLAHYVYVGKRFHRTSASGVPPDICFDIMFRMGSFCLTKMCSTMKALLLE